MTRVYDDVGEHRSRLPGDVPRKAGATHIGIFFAWCVERGLTSEWHEGERPEEFARLQRRFYSGRDYLLQYLDGRLTEEHLGNAGDDFAESYYVTGRYLEDYEATLKEHRPSLYHVPDTWESVDAIAPLLDARFQAWREGHFAPPAPALEPKPEPEPEPDPDLEPDPEPTPDLDLGPEPTPDLDLGPEPTPDLDLGPEPTPDPIEALAPPAPTIQSEPDPGFEIEPETSPYEGAAPAPAPARRRPPWVSWDPVKRRRPFKKPGKSVGRGIVIAIIAIIYGCMTSR